MSRSFVADVTTAGVASVLGRLPGAILPFFIAYWFGATGATDGFFLAYAGAVLLGGLVATSIEAGVVPFVLSAAAPSVGPLLRSAARSVGATLVALTTAALVAVLIAGKVGALRTLPPTTFSYLLQLAPLPALLGISAVYSGALNAQGRYHIPAGSHALRAITAIGCGYLLHRSIGLNGLALGLTAGELIRLILVRTALTTTLPTAGSKEKAVAKHGDLRNLLRVVAWQSLAMATLGFAPLINRVAVAHLGAGSISLVEYAERIWYIPVTLGVAGIMPVVLTRWSRARSVMTPAAFRRYVGRIHVIVGAIGILAAAGLFAGSEFLTRIALGRGDIDAQTLADVQLLVRYYAVLVPFYWLNALLERVQIVALSTHRLLVSGISRLATNAVLVVLLVALLGVRAVPVSMGVALAVAVVYLVAAAPRALRPAAASHHASEQSGAADGV